jgi:hypothetical protein
MRVVLTLVVVVEAAVRASVDPAAVASAAKTDQRHAAVGTDHFGVDRRCSSTTLAARHRSSHALAFSGKLRSKYAGW